MGKLINPFASQTQAQRSKGALRMPWPARSIPCPVLRLRGSERDLARAHTRREESARARPHAEKEERLHSACMRARHACIQWVYAYITFVSHCCMHVCVTECAPHTHRWVYIACILALARTYCARMYVGKGLMRALCEQEFVHPLCAPRSLLRGGRRDYQQRKNSRKAQCFIYEPWLSNRNYPK